MLHCLNLAFLALGGRLDLAFVLDDSGSAGDDKKNWTLVKSFASDIVNSLSISSTAVRVGMVKYSDRAFTEFYFSNHTTSSAVRAAIMNASYLGFTTNHTGALNMAKDNLFREDNGCRTNATNIIVLVTDGQQNVFDGHTLGKLYCIVLYFIDLSKKQKVYTYIGKRKRNKIQSN